MGGGSRSRLNVPFDFAQDRPFDSAQDRPFDSAQDRSFDSAQDRRTSASANEGGRVLASGLLLVVAIG
jgi:hypothetical protein